MYVSDFLEELIDGREVRDLVRSECLAITDKLPLHLAKHISPVAQYIGGKCMGYPPVWFIQQALNLSIGAIKDILQTSNTALFFSLSTSIADDLLDRDELVGGEHLMFFYMLLLEAMNRKRQENSVETFIYEQSIDAMDLFVGAPYKSQLSESTVKPLIERSTADRGKRIGNFHKMIAFDLLHESSVSKETATTLVDQVGRFGEWCAALDDAIDIEKDILDGELDNVSIKALLTINPNLKRFLPKPDMERLSPYLTSPELIGCISYDLTTRLKAIQESLSFLETPFLSRQLGTIFDKLPPRIIAMRQTVHQEFMAAREARVSLAS